MSAQRTYLDWNATAPLRPEARAAMLAAFDCVGNASSPHAEGRRARALIEGAREQIADCLKADARCVYFTSGATEAANWLLTPRITSAARKLPLELLLIGGSEHAAVREGHRFAKEKVECIPIDQDGRLELAWLAARLEAALAQHGPGATLLAVQAANNETGVLQPLARIAALVAAAGAVWVCDAVQAVGRIELAAGALGNGALLLSGHKLGGPKGVGAVVFANAELQCEPLVRGGGQERRQRSGTENIAAIAGLAAALAAETALIALDLAGVAVSSGSACSSGKVAASHVLAAMQVAPALRASALRVSTGRLTSEADVDACLAALRQIVESHAERHFKRTGVRDRQVA